MAWIGLGLLLTACVPLDGNPVAPPPTESEILLNDEEIYPPEPGAPSGDLPLLQYSTEGLGQRISDLPTSMAAYQIQQGRHPFDHGEPGSENVLLAESISTSSRFALPQKTSGNTVVVEVACSTPITLDVVLYSAEDDMLGNSMAAVCSPDTPFGLVTGMWENPLLGQVQVRWSAKADVQLSAVMFKDLASLENFE